MLNSIFMAIQADVSEIAFPQASNALQIIDNLFLMVYFFEMGIKWLDSFPHYWSSPWNVFDFCVTTVVCRRCSDIGCCFHNGGG
jgi:hypothetical protein